MPPQPQPSCCEELDAGSRFSFRECLARGVVEPTTTPKCETDVLFSIKNWSNPGKVIDFGLFSEKSMD